MLLFNFISSYIGPEANQSQSLEAGVDQPTPTGADLDQSPDPDPNRDPDQDPDPKAVTTVIRFIYFHSIKLSFAVNLIGLFILAANK